MLPFFLILVLSLFVFYSVGFMMKKGHDLHAFGFFVLYIYTIFAQIGYAYFPELSDVVGAYFGRSLFYKYWAFMFFSFVFTFLLYRIMNPKNDKTDSYIVRKTRRNFGEYIFFLFVILLYVALNLYFVMYRNLFGYLQGGGNSLGGPWFGIGYWIFTICTFILYTLIRDSSNNFKKRLFSFVVFILCILFYLRVAVAAGTRSDILYFFVAISFYELSPFIKTIKYQKRKILAVMFGGFLVISALVVLRDLRLQDENVDFSSFSEFESSESQFVEDELSAAILLQDYYLPSHTLFLSMQYKIIDPVEVIKSNAANSLVLLEYPFLTTTILERGFGTKEDRGVGWGYHYFVEGYNAMGMFGIFYNALFWNLGMILWIRLTQSNDRKYNKAMLAILVLVITLTMKSQTSAFIQFYWLILLPGLALLLMSNNSTITFIKKADSVIKKNE